MNPKKDFYRTKNTLGGILLNIYFFLFVGTLFAFLGIFYFEQKISGELWIILGESLLFLLAGICVISKLKFKTSYIWFGIFDLILFPLAIPFYLYVHKDLQQPIQKNKIQLFQLVQLSFIQTIINTFIFLFALGGWLAMIVVSWQDSYRNWVLGFVLFGFLSSFLGTASSWLNHFSIKRYGEINQIFLWMSFLFFGFGWPFPLTWLIFKPKIEINSFDLIKSDVLEFQKRSKKQLD